MIGYQWISIPNVVLIGELLSYIVSLCGGAEAKIEKITTL